MCFKVSEYDPMSKPRTGAMVSALKLETQNQYGVRDDQYEVLKSSACLQEEIMLLLLSLASLFTADSHTLKPFFLYWAFHSFFVEKAVTLNFGLLAVHSQEERTKKKGKAPCPTAQCYTKHRPESQPPPFQMLYASFSREFKMKQKTREFG